MSRPIDQLVAGMAEVGVGRDAVVRALHLLRAPRSLAGIAVAAERFRLLRKSFPEFGAFAAIDDYAQRLETLDLIANHVRGVAPFSEAGLATDADTLLRPFCGESGICDALLHRYKEGPGPEADQFERVTAWFVWQGMRYQRRKIPLDAYTEYLASDTQYLVERKGETAIYEAWLAIRTFGKASMRQLLQRFVELPPSFDAAGSERQALVFRAAAASSPSLKREMASRARRTLAMDPKDFEQRVADASGAVHPRIARFLSDTWPVENRIPQERLESLQRKFHGRQQIKSELIPYGRYSATVESIEIDGVRSGVAVEYFATSATDPVRRKRSGEEADEDEPEPEDRQGGASPEFSLFLSDRESNIAAYYAGRGLQTAIEYGNAKLPWARDRQSREAIDAALGLVVCVPTESSRQMRARLAIGISLMSGRPIEDTAEAEIEELVTDVSANKPIAICLTTYSLVVFPGEPTLKSTPKLIDLCDEHVQQLRIALPLGWRTLITECGKAKKKGGDSSTGYARALLAALPPHLKVTEAGLRRCLVRELDCITNGDPGVVQVITDGHELNLRNIAHYASYLVEEMAATWKMAAERIVGPLATAKQLKAGRVGARHGFDLLKLQDHIQEVQLRFQYHACRSDWPRAYTYLLLHTLYWLALGCASRHTRSPVPRIVVSGCWAYIDDKHIADGSMDRLLPLTPGLLAQLETLVALADHLAIGNPSMSPFAHKDGDHVLELRFANRGGLAIPFRPKTIEKELRVSCLPANWARKLIRSEGSRLGLSGRMIDAGCGHWVRGRHPYRTTSTMPVGEFRRKWLDAQETLERELGFFVQTVPEFPAPLRRLPVALPETRAAQAEQPDAMQSQSIETAKQSVEALLRDASPSLFEDLQAVGAGVPPQAAMRLVQNAIAAEIRKGKPEIATFAEQACDWVRTQFKVPLFAFKPRPQFERDWLVRDDDLQTLAWCERHLLPAFRKDLELLPAAQDDVRGGRIEMGRLLMLLVWRMGLVRRPMLEAALKWLAGDQPILATGELRYLRLTVPSRRGNELMSRTLFLDEFVTSYVLKERTRLQHLLKPYFEWDSVARRNKELARCLKAYLQSISSVQKVPTLTRLMSAATQSIMLNSSPILAAYAAGEFVTHDLDDAELRRLARLDPVRETARKKFGATSRAGDEEDAAETDIALDAEDVVRLNLPADIRRGDVVCALAGKSSPFPAQFRRDIEAVRVTGAGPKLVKAFATWSAATLPVKDGKIKPAIRTRWKSEVLVVGHCLLGILQLGPDPTSIDAETLDRLEELSEQHFSDRIAHGAWRKFRKFVCDIDADHAGFKFKDVSDAERAVVSARIFREDQIRAIDDRLKSLLSGIATYDQLLSARRTFRLSEELGARRREIAWLRSIDVQIDLIRLQPYDDHTLKTGWSERVAPTDYLSPDLQAELAHAKAIGSNRIVDPAPDQHVEADSFFDALNRAIKQVTGSSSLGLHHLRHTLASRLLLTVLRKACHLDSVFDQLPWVEGLLISDERLSVLLGGEPEMGQGIQAISALLGHSHPTTTLRHYIHTLGIAFYAAMRSMDPVSGIRTFENRLGGLSTAQRWAKDIRSAITEDETTVAGRLAINRGLRNQIERKRAYRDWVDTDEAPAPTVKPFEADRVEDPEQVSALFRRIESLDGELRAGAVTSKDPWFAGLENRFAALASLRSGRKGWHGAEKEDDMPLPNPGGRHPLEQLPDGRWVPERVDQGSAKTAALAVLEWLEKIRIDQPEEFRWLLKLWTERAERARGRMRLDDQGEHLRVGKLVKTGIVRAVIEVKAAQDRNKDVPLGADESKKTKATTPSKGTTRAVSRMRIRCRGMSKSARDTQSVRWAMSWAVAIYGDVTSGLPSSE